MNDKPLINKVLNVITELHNIEFGYGPIFEEILDSIYISEKDLKTILKILIRKNVIVANKFKFSPTCYTLNS